ncbi:MAG TPA: hypothetical protein PK175_04880 [Syntrophales bacterium]|jgi:GGDEF domain-containing protein|nr:hypothetical protein [Syntrophales bacterium]HON24157.1 hypothetical protein [Syntrophales bacterium]HOU77814.1 hypothetical protein [Syntrophales bacterium]HPC32615.1 hypothetical protein [Syntrophales bacterium]HQG34188.1 hypothetical protein [Syntrophales bacterium]
MEDKESLNQLEELAARLGMKIRYESLPAPGNMRLGGCCRVKGEEFVIIHRRASLQDKIQIIVDALKRHDLSDVYVLPSLRKMLDKDR